MDTNGIPDDTKKQIYTALDANDWETAEKLLRSEVEKSPNYYHTHYVLGYVLRASSTYQKSRLNEALKEQQEALDMLRDKRYAGWIYYELGLIHSDYSNNERNEGKALESFYSSIACESAPYDAYLRAARLVDHEDIDEKIRLLTVGLERFPNDVAGYIELEQALRNLKHDLDAAETVLQKALDKGLSSASIYDALAHIKLKQDMPDEAIYNFNRIYDLEVSPEILAFTGVNIASLYISRSQYDVAERYLQKAMEQHENVDLQNAISFGLIICYQYTGRQDKACDCLPSAEMGQI